MSRDAELRMKEIMKEQESELMSKELSITIKYFDGEIEKVQKIPQGDWIDLRCRINYEGKAGEYKQLPLGVAMKLPKGYEAHILPRSSSFKKFGFIQTNSMGIIDESYCGDNDEWLLPVYFLRDSIIKKGDRICQFRIVPKMPTIDFNFVHSLEQKNRGGLGTTGTN